MENILAVKGILYIGELLLKSTVILLITLLATFFYRKKTAAFKHMILVTAMIALLLLPLLGALLPQWQTNLLPFPVKQTHNSIIQTVTYTEAHSPIQTEFISPSKTGSSLIGFFKSNASYLIFALWCLGIATMLIKLMIGFYNTFRLTRQGILIKGDPWKQLFSHFLRRTPIKQKIRILKNNQVPIPMTWGFRKPVILLPGTSSNWSVQQCSSALFHELSHIKRGDFLVRLIARIACAMYWLNPLALIVFRKLKQEQEKACDEMVLRLGIKPSTYATCLLNMKQSLSKKRQFAGAAIGMASHSEFTERLTSILKKEINIKKEEKMKTKLSLLVLAVFTIVLIGTAKPMQEQTSLINDGAVVVDEVKTEKKVAKEEKEKKEKKEKKCVKEEKIKIIIKTAEGDDEQEKHVFVTSGKDDCKKGEKQIFVTVTEDDEGKKGETRFKKIIVHAQSDKSKKIKVDGDKLIILKDGKELKTINLKDIDKNLKWISEDGEKIKIITEKIQMQEGDEDGEHLIFIEEGDSKTKKEYRKINIKHKGDKGHKMIFYGDDKGAGHKELAEKVEAMKKAMDNLKVEMKEKSPAQIEAIQKMEETIKKMEKEVSHQKMNIQKFHKFDFQKKGDLHEKHIELIKEKDGKVFHIKKGKDARWVTKDMDFGKAGVHMKFIVKTKIDKKQTAQVKKALKKLAKDLPKDFKVDSKFKEGVISISVDYPEKETDEKNMKKGEKEIKKFEEELKKIIPSKDGEKRIMKMITINEKKEK